MLIVRSERFRVGYCLFLTAEGSPYQSFNSTEDSAIEDGSYGICCCSYVVPNFGEVAASSFRDWICRKLCHIQTSGQALSTQPAKPRQIQTPVIKGEAELLTAVKLWAPVFSWR
jgi:hypothetical protein